MTIALLEPRKALNKAFLPIKLNRPPIELFQSNLIIILDTIMSKLNQSSEGLETFEDKKMINGV